MTRPEGEYRWIGSSALALVWPPAVGRAAAGAPWWVCWALSAVSVAACGGAWIAPQATTGAEPFLHMLDYVATFLSVALVMTLLACVPALILTFAAMGSFHVWASRRTPARLARVRVLMLAPLAGVMPFLGARVCTLMIAGRSASCPFTWAPKPDWMYSGVFDVGQLALTALAIVCVVFAIFTGLPVAARLAPTGSSCGACGYDLKGNVSGTCPECGRPVGRAKTGSP